MNSQELKDRITNSSGASKRNEYLRRRYRYARDWGFGAAEAHVLAYRSKQTIDAIAKERGYGGQTTIANSPEKTTKGS